MIGPVEVTDVQNEVPVDVLVEVPVDVPVEVTVEVTDVAVRVPRSGRSRAIA